ncbi:transmembrane protein 201-like [Pocillopora damicornis]|uniref:transmembrane protein 201-like n=1 Tax=Pocillopora damicornis TaxID=46731 RepID=UPI000F5566E1|nr:transmembrane protein 201-like [Pocillopora damicornis]
MVDCVGENDSTHYHYAAPGRYTGQPSLVTQPQLCHNCNKNQATKIQELNSFEPSRESDFFSEFDAHKNHLDKRYKLCHSCHNTVQHHLNLQEKDLKTFVLGTHLQKSKSTPTKLKHFKIYSPESIIIMLAKLTCVFLAALLVFSDSPHANHNNCGEFLSYWSISFVANQDFWSSFPHKNMTTASACLLLTQLFQVAVRTSWQKSLELMLCLCSLARRKYLHILLCCLLMNFLIFLKKKSRFGILILVSWTLLSALRFWEVFWRKTDTRWHTRMAVFCLILDMCSFLFSLLSYARGMVRRKKKRCQFTPSPSSVEKHHTSAVDSNAMDTSTCSESTPSHRKTSTELDHNLNGLSLGLPTKRKNGYRNPLSAGNFGTGFFWSQTLSNNSEETPLVSMQQRPLIVPATLHFSGLRDRSPAARTLETQSVARSGGNSYTISSDEDSESESDTKDENFQRNSHLMNDRKSKSKRIPRRTKRQTFSPKIIMTPITRSLLLLASLLLNAYFIVSFTDWPQRILLSLRKVSGTSK